MIPSWELTYPPHPAIWLLSRWFSQLPVWWNIWICSLKGINPSPFFVKNKKWCIVDIPDSIFRYIYIDTYIFFHRFRVIWKGSSTFLLIDILDWMWRGAYTIPHSKIFIEPWWGKRYFCCECPTNHLGILNQEKFGTFSASNNRRVKHTSFLWSGQLRSLSNQSSSPRYWMYGSIYLHWGKIRWVKSN